MTRNCALYERVETYEEKAIEGYDSYYCEEAQAESGGWVPNQGTAAVGIIGKNYNLIFTCICCSIRKGWGPKNKSLF